MIVANLLYKLPFNKWNIKPNHINIFFKHPNEEINDVCFLMKIFLNLKIKLKFVMKVIYI